MKFSESWLRKPIASFAVATSALALSGCFTPPKEIKALTGPTYAELMASAEAAQTKGSNAEALGFLERAAKSDPAQKMPWLRIAQAQFDARNYGAAISAAQEVLQRDNADVTAKSIMAASGLRVSAVALEQLREANALGGTTREEAQTLARTMREALGESILPAPVAPTAQEKAPPRPVRRAAAAVRAVEPSPVSTNPAPAPAARAAAPAPAPAPAPAQPRRNPFDALR